MTKPHTIDHYLDNRVRVAFCVDCSAEGEKLFGECNPFKSGLLFFKGLTKEEFEEKYNKAVDSAKPKP